MAAAPSPPALRFRPVVRRTGSRRSRQRTLFCPCGQGTPAIAGLCRSCYRARSHSRTHFAGNREWVLERDGGCRGCGAGKASSRLHVHHRRPGLHDSEWLIALCAACHARVHRLSALRYWLPEPVIAFWAEQHPGVPLQLQFSLPSGEPAAGA